MSNLFTFIYSVSGCLVDSEKKKKSDRYFALFCLPHPKYSPKGARSRFCLQRLKVQNSLFSDFLLFGGLVTLF